jgi:hypothetical protein
MTKWMQHMIKWITKNIKERHWKGSPASVCMWCFKNCKLRQGLEVWNPLNWGCNETMCDPARFQLLRLFPTINELGGLHLLWDIYSLTAFKRVASLCGVIFSGLCYRSYVSTFLNSPALG